MATKQRYYIVYYKCVISDLEFAYLHDGKNKASDKVRLDIKQRFAGTEDTLVRIAPVKNKMTTIHRLAVQMKKVLTYRLQSAYLEIILELSK